MKCLNLMHNPSDLMRFRSKRELELKEVESDQKYFFEIKFNFFL